MKKILNIIISVILIFSCFTVFSQTNQNYQSNKSNIILYEDFEEAVIPEGWSLIDADGDGFNWEFVPWVHSGHNSQFCISSASWRPDQGGQLTPDNYLITPMLENAHGLMYWVNVQDVHFPLEHYAVLVSFTGTEIEDFKIIFEETLTAKNDVGIWHKRILNLPEGTKYVAWRHYDCTNMYFLNLDDVTIFDYLPEPVTNFNAQQVDLKIGHLTWDYPIDYNSCDTNEWAVELKGYKIYANNSLIASINDPDILEYYDSTFLSKNDDIVNVEYCISAVYNNNLESELVCKTITYLYNIVLYEDFEDGLLPQDWLLVDADGDGYNWEISEWVYSGHNSEKCISSASKRPEGGILTPDNYLITPLLNNPNVLTYWVNANNENYPNEHYAVMVSSSENNIENFEIIFEETLTAKKDGENWHKRTLNLPKGTKYIAWRHFNSTNMSFLNLDDIFIYNFKSKPISNLKVTLVENNVGRLTWDYPLDYKPLDIENEYINLTGYNIYANNSLIASINDPDILEYYDSTYYCKKETLHENYNLLNNKDETADVEYYITAVYNNVVESEEVRDTIVYNFSSYITFYEEFENGEGYYTIFFDGWTVIDADGDGYTWGYPGYNYHVISGHNSMHCAFSCSEKASEVYTPDNYLITPQLEKADAVSYWVSVHDRNKPFDHYALLASTTGNNIDDFVTLFEETLTYKTPGEWYQRNIELPPGTKYVAWRHYNCTNMSYIKLDDVAIYSNDGLTPSPITNLNTTLQDNNIGLLTWDYPTNFQQKNNDKSIKLSGYNIYANDSLIAKIRDKDVLEFYDSTYYYGKNKAIINSNNSNNDINAINPNNNNNDNINNNDINDINAINDNYDIINNNDRNDDSTIIMYCITAIYNNVIESERTCETLSYSNINIDNYSDQNIEIFPNPGKDIITIEGANIQKILIYNSIGQLVEIIKNTNEVRVSNYQKGIYIFKIIEVDGKKHEAKVVVN